jgi:hypothetical protein
MSFAKDESYRKCEEKINRIRWQEGEQTQARTIANVIEREGTQIIAAIEEKADRILETNGFDKEGKPMEPESFKSVLSEEAYLSEESVKKAIDEYNEGKDEEFQIKADELHKTFENPSECVNISVDEVGVVHQKETGRSPEHVKKEHREYVRNTVVHIENGKNTYVLNGLGLTGVLRLIIAFLLHNNLLQKGAIVFFVDGARDLHAAIKCIFNWLPFRMILDWYHLEEKCKMQLSLALKGKDVRNQVLQKILAFLWIGKIDNAIDVLRQVESKDIKSKAAIDRLIGYFQRNREYIPCYALRKKLGLRNSSNRGEKANDLAVSKRQKHNGTSWSRGGSAALASIIVLHKNNEQYNWINNRDISFKLTA